MNSTAGTRSDPLLDTPTVAAELGLNVRTVVRLIDRGELGHVRLGRLLKVKRSQVEAYLARATVDAER